jgi:hypothetical protein
VNTIALGKNESSNISELRNNACNYQKSLEIHIENLVKWNIIKDEKPKSNGYARKFTLVKPYGDCMMQLMRLKEAIDTVNEFFIS